MPTLNPYDDARFRGHDVVDALDDSDFADLLRSVELVVQSQAFSRQGLQYALRLDSAIAARMTLALEAMGIIVGGPADRRRVLAALDRLPVVLAELRSSRVLQPAVG